jgi:hypothetical protein
MKITNPFKSDKPTKTPDINPSNTPAELPPLKKQTEIPISSNPQELPLTPTPDEIPDLDEK